MREFAVRATFWAAGAAIALFCFGRAWRFGRSGFDADGLPKNRADYGQVQLWGTVGIALTLFILADLFFLFFPSEPPSMRSAPQ